ncbi:MAG: hypothetical protein QM718_03310 [Steroidobacteraceae bacterium]
MDIRAPLMRLISQLGFLKIGSQRESDVEDKRVLHLFRKRAELKQAYGASQDEVMRLRDRVKQQEGATARVQELLAEQELRLSRQESGYPLLVHFQLRELWEFAHGLLKQFIADLAAQQEERERRQLLADFNRGQFGKRQEAEARVNQAEHVHLQARNTCAEYQRQLEQLQRFWHYFRRRHVRQLLQAASMSAMLNAQDLETARGEAEALRAELPPEFPGLSVDARRMINLSAVGYGQLLCERLRPGRLLMLAREASAQRLPREHAYGERKDCEQLMAEIRVGRQLLAQRGDLPQQIRLRCEQLRSTVRYRSAAETLPEPGSVAALGSSPESAALLRDDLFDIYRAVLR